MRKTNRLTCLALFLALLCFPQAADAQQGSLNAFSPYTFYGIGDLTVQGPAFLRSMGGAGVAYNHPQRINYLNPASYAAANPKSAVFSVGFEGGGIYSRTVDAKSSYNFYNFRDIALQLPIVGGKLGLGISVTPFSSVGYQVRMYETDPYFLATIGTLEYQYTGDGNITQAKAGIGYTPFKNFFIGAEFVYFHGSTVRNYNEVITASIGNDPYLTLQGTDRRNYSKPWMNFGVQYAPIATEKQKLSVGVTFTPRVNLRPRSSVFETASYIYIDTIRRKHARVDDFLPTQITAGVLYQRFAWGAALDYTFQKWSGLNENDIINDIKFTNNSYLKAGLYYTPNVGDVRSYLRRVTYRFGYRYNDYYMEIKGHKIQDHAITFGVTLPFRQRLNNIDVGFELGQRGLTKTGTFDTKQFQMVRERYFKISVGLSLFGEDYWFMKPKYD